MNVNMNVWKTWKRRNGTASKLFSLVFCLVLFCFVITGIAGGAGASAQSPNTSTAASTERHSASYLQVISVLGGVR
jgi:hypothetical protein